MADTVAATTEQPRAITPPRVEEEGHIVSQNATETQVASHSAVVEGNDGVSHDAADIAATKEEPGEPMSKVRALAPDSNRAKGALQQTIGSTKEVLGEILHMEKLRKAGEEQRLEGEAREEAALRRDAGSGVTDALETGLRKAVKTLKGDRKSSVSDASTGARQSSVDETSGPPDATVADAPADLTGTGVETHDHARTTTDIAHDAPTAHHGGLSSEPTAVAADVKLEAQAIAGDPLASHPPGVSGTHIEHQPVAGEAHREPEPPPGGVEQKVEPVVAKGRESEGML